MSAIVSLVRGAVLAGWVRGVRVRLVAPVLLGVSLASTACSGAATGLGGKPGPMPSGGKWQGLYEGPHFLYLQIGVKDARARGAWRGYGGVEGQLAGRISGNLLRYNWVESKETPLGKTSWSGRGYFVYTTPEPGKFELRGEWGVGSAQPSRPMWATRRGDAQAADLLQLDDDLQLDDGSGSYCVGGCNEED